MQDFKIDKRSFVRSCKNRDILEDYDFVKELGSGTYGIVYEAIHRTTGERRAIKAICKEQVEDEEVFKNELTILKQLDHPNIVKLYEIYEYGNELYMVTELCEGGELFYYITKQKHLSEAQAAKIMRQMFSAVAYLHANKICHRDIKPENFLLKYDDDDSNIKLIDFGLSRKLREDEVMHEPDGTPFYIAPEMLEGNYNEAVDNWALGVLLYVMLSGSPPFYGKDNKEILRAVQRGIYTLALKPFMTCSIEVKDLISKLLVRNTSKRYTSALAYNHPWVQQQVEEESRNLAVDSDVMGKISEFLESQAFKKTILLYIAQQIPENEIDYLKKLFVKIDTNGNGTLSLEEFEIAFSDFQSNTTTLKKNFSKDDIHSLFQAIDSNNNGVIDYSEFIAVFAEHHLFKTEKYLKMVFDRFDLDKNGKINKQELRKLLSGGSLVPLDQVETIIRQADIDGDGELDQKEVLRYIKQSRSFQERPSSRASSRPQSSQQRVA